jgi:hypothetical protein
MTGLELPGRVADDNLGCFPRKEMAMNLQPRADATQEPLPPDPYADYRPVYGWLFQAWLVMFLAVICIALIAYLLSYIPR